MRVLCVAGYSDRPETETFIGLKEKGVDIEVICQPTAPHIDRLLDSGVDTVPLEIRSRIDLRAIGQIRRRLINGKVDILHGFTNKAISNAIIASTGIPVRIITYRGTVGNLSCWNPGAWTTHLNPRVDKVVCVSNAVLNHFLHMKIFGFYMNPNKFITIHKGHEPTWYAHPPADLTKFGIPEDAFVVSCVANYRRHKGIEVLIEAAELLEKYPQIHILIVGKLNNASHLVKIDRENAKSNVHFTGYQANAAALVAASDLFVLPVIRREGFPKTLIEAMAQGIPPVVTNVGGVPEIADRNCSLIVPPGNSRALAHSIQFLFENPDRRKHLGEKAKERIREHFTIERTIHETYELYCELTGQDGKI